MAETLETRFDHKSVEEKIYKLWERSGYFNPDNLAYSKWHIANGKRQKKSKAISHKPFAIIMPPPNANGSLHLGHAVFITLQDILIRFWRMRGRKTLWLPGADHAGFETQVVFDKKLEKEGRNRFEIDRETLFQEIWDFTQTNKKIMESQLRQLGASCDWSREKFTLDPDIIKIVYETFEKLYKDGLVYRDLKVINWCPKHKTALSDLEVKYVERKDPLYYIKYGPLTLATVRPETKFGDTALAVNPRDKRYKDYLGKEIEAQGVLGPLKFKVIADEAVDPKFGTGVIKVTPAHDPADFEIWQRHKNEIPDPFDPAQGKPKIVIDEDGRLTGETGPFKGLKVLEAREKVAREMERLGILKKIEPDCIHQVATCYKCGTVLEPLPKPQWFVKTKPLARKAIAVVKQKKIGFYPEHSKKIYFHWLENIRDWNISRQIVWGIRIPAWFCINASRKIGKKMGFHESVVPQVFAGKTKTYRLRDHDFQKGDIVAFENSQTQGIFGYGKITNVVRTKVGKINLQDKAHGKTYNTIEELIAAFKRHHPDKEIDENTEAFIYAYKFEKNGSGCDIKMDSAIKGRWFIVRHGESKYNKEKRSQGWADRESPLTEQGIRQAEQAGAALKDKKIDLIISSDLERCRMTAEIIRKITGAEIIFDKELRERHLGITQGMPAEARKEMYGHLLYEYDEKPPGGETWREFEKRIWSAFLGHKKNHRHKNIAIVTHGGPLRILSKNLRQFSFEEMLAYSPENAEITELGLSSPCKNCGSDIYEQDPDVFDTWFSSGQWPFATLLAQSRSISNLKTQNSKSRKKIFNYTTKDFEEFYPTDVMETGYDILFFWVARMIMLGLYRTGKIPFRIVYLHGMVRDKDRQKMSKSKGNVIDPLGVAEIYGADALRMALVAGNTAGNDIVISEEKIRGYRNFATKIWNISRFILMNKPRTYADYTLTDADGKHLNELRKIKKQITKHLENFEFHLAAEKLYHYIWHTFADKIIEEYKERLRAPAIFSEPRFARSSGERPLPLVPLAPPSAETKPSGTPRASSKNAGANIEEDCRAAYQTLETILLECLKMLHPFMPFITEEIYRKFKPGKLLMVEKWQ